MTKSRNLLRSEYRKPSGAASKTSRSVADYGSQGLTIIGWSTSSMAYTVKLAGWVFVLHCFQKKSKSGISIPEPDMDMVISRLKAAKQDFEIWQAQHGVRK